MIKQSLSNAGEMSLDLGKTIYLSDRKSWRDWLAEHHDSESEVWLIYYRKETGKPRISYNDAVEEALCYGWVDSTVRGIDEEQFAQRFSSRTPTCGIPSRSLSPRMAASKPSFAVRCCPTLRTLGTRPTA